MNLVVALVWSVVLGFVAFLVPTWFGFEAARAKYRMGLLAWLIGVGLAINVYLGHGLNMQNQAVSVVPVFLLTPLYGFLLVAVFYLLFEFLAAKAKRKS